MYEHEETIMENSLITYILILFYPLRQTQLLNFVLSISFLSISKTLSPLFFQLIVICDPISISISSNPFPSKHAISQCIHLKQRSNLGVWPTFIMYPKQE